MVRGKPRDAICKSVPEYLDVVGLTGMANRDPGQLSGGQRQRVALARALICASQLLLRDEPLAALDEELRRQMQVFLKTLQRRSGVTFLLVSHDQEEAIALSDRICVMSNGHFEQVGPTEELYYQPESRFVVTFFGDSNLIDGCRLDVRGTSVYTPFASLTLDIPTRYAGAEATLCIRPESLGLEPAPDATAEAVSGRLQVEAKVLGRIFGGFHASGAPYRAWASAFDAVGKPSGYVCSCAGAEIAPVRRSRGLRADPDRRTERATRGTAPILQSAAVWTPLFALILEPLASFLMYGFSLSKTITYSVIRRWRPKQRRD